MIQAYVLFEIAASADVRAATDKLRSTSLGNCLQLVIGVHLRDVFVHIACDQGGDLNETLLRLSRVDGVARATVLSLKTATD